MSKPAMVVFRGRLYKPVVVVFQGSEYVYLSCLSLMGADCV